MRRWRRLPHSTHFLYCLPPRNYRGAKKVVDRGSCLNNSICTMPRLIVASEARRSADTTQVSGHISMDHWDLYWFRSFLTRTSVRRWRKRVRRRPWPCASRSPESIKGWESGAWNFTPPGNSDTRTTFDRPPDVPIPVDIMWGIILIHGCWTHPTCVKRMSLRTGFARLHLKRALYQVHFTLHEMNL